MIAQPAPAHADPTTAGFGVRRRARLHSTRQLGASEPSPFRAPRFSEQEIVAKVLAWTARYGAPPATTDWEPSRARAAKQEWRARRFEEGEWPSASMVRRRFGTFNAAIRAAGLEPRGCPPRQKAHLSGPDQVLAAIVEWTRRYGAPPSQTDWDSARARRTGQTWRIARYEDGDWPSFKVRRHRIAPPRDLELVAAAPARTATGARTPVRLTTCSRSRGARASSGPSSSSRSRSEPSPRCGEPATTSTSDAHWSNWPASPWRGLRTSRRARATLRSRTPSACLEPPDLGATRSAANARPSASRRPTHHGPWTRASASRRRPPLRRESRGRRPWAG